MTRLLELLYGVTFVLAVLLGIYKLLGMLLRGSP
jgi:hypothetical protein